MSAYLTNERSGLHARALNQLIRYRSQDSPNFAELSLAARTGRKGVLQTVLRDVSDLPPDLAA